MEVSEGSKASELFEAVDVEEIEEQSKVEVILDDDGKVSHIWIGEKNKDYVKKWKIENVVECKKDN